MSHTPGSHTSSKDHRHHRPQTTSPKQRGTFPALESARNCALAPSHDPRVPKKVTDIEARILSQHPPPLATVASAPVSTPNSAHPIPGRTSTDHPHHPHRAPVPSHPAKQSHSHFPLPSPSPSPSSGHASLSNSIPPNVPKSFAHTRQPQRSTSTSMDDSAKQIIQILEREKERLMDIYQASIRELQRQHDEHKAKMERQLQITLAQNAEFRAEIKSQRSNEDMVWAAGQRSVERDRALEQVADITAALGEIGIEWQEGVGKRSGKLRFQAEVQHRVDAFLCMTKGQQCTNSSDCSHGISPRGFFRFIAQSTTAPALQARQKQALQPIATNPKSADPLHQRETTEVPKHPPPQSRQSSRSSNPPTTPSPIEEPFSSNRSASGSDVTYVTVGDTQLALSPTLSEAELPLPRSSTPPPLSSLPDRPRSALQSGENKISASSPPSSRKRSRCESPEPECRYRLVKVRTFEDQSKAEVGRPRTSPAAPES